MRESVAGILYKNSTVLIARRLMEGSMGGRWEFPGGKVESGESRQKALIREFDEEFEAVIVPGNCITQTSFVHKEKERNLFAFQIFTDEDPLNWTLREHSEVRWVPLKKIAELSFVDSDLLLLPELIKWEKSL